MVEKASVAGVLNVAKRRGPTSHDVVDEVRRVLGLSRVGHAGTLDPPAGGVLPVLLGRATRLASFFLDYRKQYRAVIKLGAETDTGDDAGKVLYRRAVPQDAYDALTAVVASFIGEITQEVPPFAAVKSGGVPLYQRARRGEKVLPPARRVHVYRFVIEKIQPPTFTAFIECGSGTYVRALARDLGRKLGTGAYVCDLTRLAVGPFVLADALRQERLASGRDEILQPPHFTPAALLLPELPSLTLSEGDLKNVVVGRPIMPPTPIKPGLKVRLIGPGGNLIGIGVAGAGVVKPDIVLLAPEELF